MSRQTRSQTRPTTESGDDEFLEPHDRQQDDSALAVRVTAIENRLTTITTQLNRLVSLLDGSAPVQTTTTRRTVDANEDPEPNIPVPVVTDTKFFDIAPFDGTKPRELKAFLGRCTATFMLHPASFRTAQTRILFTGQHLTGRAGDWFVANYLDLSNRNPERFDSYEEFETSFKLNFADADSSRTAISAILNLVQTKSAKEYTQLFNTYANDTGFNTVALIEHYRKGLKPEIKNVIMTVGSMPTTLKAYQDRTIEIDQRVSEREKEQRAEQARKPAETYRRSVPTKVPDAGSTVIKVAEPTTTFMRLTDEQKADFMKKGLCFKCKQQGHRATACPNTNPAKD